MNGCRAGRGGGGRQPRAYEVRKVRGPGDTRYFATGELAAAAYVGGGFLNSAGQPHPPLGRAD